MKVLLAGGRDGSKRIALAKELVGVGCDVAVMGRFDHTVPSPRGIELVDYQQSTRAALVSHRVGDELLEGIAGLNPDVIHTFTTIPGLEIPRHRGAAAVVKTVTGRGTAFPFPRSRVRLPIQAAYRRLQRASTQHVDHWVFQNSVDKRWFEQNVLPTGTSTSMGGSGVECRYEPEPERSAAANAVRTAMGIEPDTVLVLMAGRIIRPKGTLDLIRAAHMLRHQGVVLALAGSRHARPWDRVPNRVVRTAPDNVHFLGERNDVADVMGAADIVALPTRYGEGLPRSLLEACAARKAVVSTAAPGCADIVVDKVTGRLVRPRSPVELANVISELTSDREAMHTLGKNARQHVCAEFALDKVVPVFLDAYERAIARRSKG
ncbi:MAG: glycosyltransferase family 4 protein [Actinomycetia bacterium]|nr:glycosyltransferase family 4 protein [Actinomycetes bacterium]